MIKAFTGVIDSEVISRTWDAADDGDVRDFNERLSNVFNARLRRHYPDTSALAHVDFKFAWLGVNTIHFMKAAYHSLAFASMREFRTLGVKILLCLGGVGGSYGMYPREGVDDAADDMDLFRHGVQLDEQRLRAHSDPRIIGYAIAHCTGNFYRVKSLMIGDVPHAPLDVTNVSRLEHGAASDVTDDQAELVFSTPYAAPAADDVCTPLSCLFEKRTVAVMEQIDRVLHESLNRSQRSTQSHDNSALGDGADSSSSSRESSDAGDVYDERRVEHVNDSDDVLVDAVVAAVHACLVDVV